MPLTEINFDGLVGPSHNYAGLSLGNLASSSNAGAVSHPRDAALQGVEKMRANLGLGLTQGLLLPQRRPNKRWLTTLGARAAKAEPVLLANAMSASAMWAANAATVSPAPDTRDGRCHLTVANLMTMPHRSHEWRETLAQLRIAFADETHFAVHPPVPPPFGDEGAANHMRLASGHAAPGIEVFVYGARGGAFPVRQRLEACQAVARLHRLDPERVLFVQQSERAIAGGAFHNDVVAVANENLLLCHGQAFADRDGVFADFRRLLPDIQIVEVPASRVPLETAIRSYLFNSQLVTLPEGGMALVLPTESRDELAVWSWLEELVATNGAIRRLIPVDVRESMANGGGPACLRLRVLADPAHVDPRFLVDNARLDRVAEVIAARWPEAIDSERLADRSLWAEIETARTELCRALELDELV
ncbi:MAG: N-succinylarginine dihydrolase [Parasphingopyxis sp.]|nr:N-succinylarginine dihydrolase [Sphingomonadales bacterium]